MTDWTNKLAIKDTFLLYKSITSAQKFDINRLTSMSYNPYFDILRGVAIILVTCEHLHILKNYGFLGVDIFFVLSGFLITKILMNNLKSTPKQYLQNFYIKRIARLLPVSLVYIILIFFATQIFHVIPYISSYWEYAGCIFYFKNFQPFGGPLGHFWTLSAEEQFYLVYPCILYYAFKFKRRNILLTLLIIGYLTINIYGSIRFAYHQNTDGIFALTLFRPSAILLGCIVAMLVKKKDIQIPLTAFTLLFSLLSAYVLATRSASVTGLLTALILIKADSAEFARQNRSTWRVFKLLKNIGVLSYSIYIWQIVVIGFVDQFLPRSSFLAICASVFLLICVSLISFWLIEIPAQRVLINSLLKRAKPA
jgi:peptidoglycan/LPS O-acetylase OafA/YrhL